MTQVERQELEKDVLYTAFVAEREAAAHRVRLGLIGEQLERLGRALQDHPEAVTALPDPHSLYDYSQDLNALNGRQIVIELCKELQILEQKQKTAQARKGMLNL